MDHRQPMANRHLEIVQVFLRLGALAFGGPAAHIAMMEDEIVVRRKWVTKEKFIDLLGFTNLIPGPNSTEMAIHLGLERGGRLGLLLAGVSFILPAMAIVLALAYAYVRFGSIPSVAHVLDGVKPVVLAVVVQALCRLGGSILKKRDAALLAAGALAASLLGVREIPILLAAGLLLFGWRRLRKPRAGIRLQVVDPMSIGLLFLLFLKIGSVLYGSGYVLLAFLRAEFVGRYAVLSTQQLLDAVAVGQFTPGPVFTTATFVGYLIRGVPGAVLATVGNFLPSFLLVLLLHPLIDRMRRSPIVSDVLDGVNAASIALMAAVTLTLGRATLITLPAAAIFAAAAVLLVRFKVNSTWLILGGGAAGYLMSLL